MSCEDAGQRQALDLERDLADRCAGLVHVLLERPADHQADDLGVVELADARRCATLLPSRKMVTRSQSARTSSRRCEMKTMVRPSSRSRRAMANSVSTSLRRQAAPSARP